jgi:hypothetical protein
MGGELNGPGDESLARRKATIVRLFERADKALATKELRSCPTKTIALQNNQGYKLEG